MSKDTGDWVWKAVLYSSGLMLLMFVVSGLIWYSIIKEMFE